MTSDLKKLLKVSVVRSQLQNRRIYDQSKKLILPSVLTTSPIPLPLSIQSSPPPSKRTMALRLPTLLLPRLTPLTLCLGLTSTTAYLLHTHTHTHLQLQRPILCEASSPLDTLTQKYLHTDTSGRKIEVKKEGGRVRIVRQLALGSVMGVVGGVAVGMFSRVLGVLLGVGFMVVQVCFVDPSTWG